MTRGLAETLTTRPAGLESWEYATILAANAAETLVALGRTEQAAALIDPLTTTPRRNRTPRHG